MTSSVEIGWRQIVLTPLLLCQPSKQWAPVYKIRTLQKILVICYRRYLVIYCPDLINPMPVGTVIGYNCSTRLV